MGYQQRRVSSLHLPGEIAKRRKQQHVIDLAADIAELGQEPINAPVFSRDGEIIAGRDRMAALLINGAKKVWVRIADATEQERRDLEVSENLFRRVDNRDELIARRVRKVVETIETTRHTESPNIPLGTARQIKSVALKRVARETGLSTQTVRKIAAKDSGAGDGSASPKDRNTADHAPSPPGTICPVDTFGIATTPAFNERVSSVCRVLEEVNALLVRAQSVLAGLKSSEFEGSLYQRLKAEIHAAAANVRYAKPAMVCVYCRDPGGAEGRAAHCNGCDRRGYLREEQRAAVPRELLAKGAKAVAGLGPIKKATLKIVNAEGEPIEIDPPPEELPF